MSPSIVALIGAPNTGKSSLFNSLTGANQKVGNYPGVTIEKKYGRAKTPGGRTVNIIDLPGTYSLTPQSADEKVTVDVLFHRLEGVEQPDAILAIADATNLERTLGLVLGLTSLGLPVVVALNMYDLASRRGLKLDVRALERELKVRVVPTVAVKKAGTAPLLEALDKVMVPAGQPKPVLPKEAPVIDPSARQREVDQLLSRVVKEPTRADIWTERLDQVLLHPVLGGVLLAAILMTIFQAVFSWAEAPMGWIEESVAALAEYSKSLLPEGALQSLIADGLIAGVGSVLVFLPQILILFFFILLLEGSGYMARAAFIMDRLMGLVGLQGRSFVPLLSSFACAIPGMMAARTIRSPRDRLLTILIAPLMTCSARLPVYALLIGAFVPNVVVFGPLKMQGLVLFALFLVAILSAMLVALALRSSVMRGGRSPFLMDLPTYKLPGLKYMAVHLFNRAKAFVKKAGTLILMISMGLWFLSSYPKPPQGASGDAITYSFAGRLGAAIEPVIAPLGFDWRIATGLIPGFAAREVMVGALGTVFAVEDAEESGMQTLQEKIQKTWGLPTGLALLAWYVFAPQCLATMAVARRETNSRAWTAFMFAYMLVLAYAAAWVTYRVAVALV